MRSWIFIMPLVMLYTLTFSQIHGGVEQYSYAGHKRVSTIVPRAYYQDEKNWYGEVRYNYDEIQTFSINAGKTFAKDNAITYAITPMVGIMVGTLQGSLLSFKVESGYEKIFFSAESQYALSVNSSKANYFFNWTEIGYEVTDNIYTGFALQLTRFYKAANQWEPGIMAGFSINKFTFPLFVFSPTRKSRYFVLGINMEWGGVKNQRNQMRCFSF